MGLTLSEPLDLAADGLNDLYSSSNFCRMTHIDALLLLMLLLGWSCGVANDVHCEYLSAPWNGAKAL